MLHPVKVVNKLQDTFSNLGVRTPLAYIMLLSPRMQHLYALGAARRT